MANVTTTVALERTYSGYDYCAACGRDSAIGLYRVVRLTRCDTDEALSGASRPAPADSPPVTAETAKQEFRAAITMCKACWDDIISGMSPWD